MAIAKKKGALEDLFLDKEEIRRQVREVYNEIGIPDDPTATAEKSRELFLAAGFRPEDNEFSRGIIEMREE
jgi:hypothetical protein